MWDNPDEFNDAMNRIYLWLTIFVAAPLLIGLLVAAAINDW